MTSRSAKYPTFFKKLLVSPLSFFSKYYFRTEIRGLEHLPNRSALLVGNHNMHPFVPDTQALLALYHGQNTPRAIRAMTQDVVLKIPLIGFIAKKLSCISCSFESGRNALQEGHHVLIYPGGGWESCRPSRDRDQVTFKDRCGFIKLAIAADAPIIPIVSAGAQDGWWVLTRGDRIARFLRLNKLKIDVFPIALGLPFGLIIGPLFPFFPLPRKCLIQILPAIDPKKLVDELGTPEQAAHEVLRQMQFELSRLALDLPRNKRYFGASSPYQ